MLRSPPPPPSLTLAPTPPCSHIHIQPRSEFFDAARAATADVLDRGKVAVVAGGTGMYLRWFLHGKPATPQSTPEGSARASAALEAAADALGAGACEEQRWEAAVAALERAGDGVSGRKLARNDWYRLTRAMEIVQESGGIPKGQFSAPHKLAATGRGDNAEGTGAPAPTSLLGSSWAGSVASSAPLGEALDCDVHCFAVGVRPRQALYRAIDRRVEHMFQEGLLDEAAWLLESGAAPGSCCGARAIGYAQAIDLLVHTQQQGHQGTRQGGEGGEQGQGLAATADDVRRAVAETQRATRNFAKRQLTWLRGDATFAWLDGSDGTSAMADAVERALRGEQQSGDDAVRWSGTLTKEEEREMRRYEGRLTDFAEGADAANEAAAWVTQWAMATPAAAAASAANAP